MSGVKAGGRALEKPVCHYSLSWAEDETPSLKEVGRAVTESLEVMGMADRQAVMVAHRDTAQPHVHVVVNRVSVEDGRAAKLGNSYLKLSRWAEGYERDQGHIRCPQRVGEQRREGSWGVGPVCVYEAGAVPPGTGAQIADPPPAGSGGRESQRCGGGGGAAGG